MFVCVGFDASVFGPVFLCVFVCVLASVVPVRHDRRRELKAVGTQRPSHTTV